MKRILLLYFSGAGSTKTVAKKIYTAIGGRLPVDIYAVDQLPALLDMNDYHGFIIGYPVHHAHPPKRLLRFFDAVPALRKPRPAFLFNTRGWYSANSHRILAKRLASKNIRVVMDTEYRAPASDGSLLAPFVPAFWRFEAGLERKIADDCDRFVAEMNRTKHCVYLPGFRLYSIINAPNKLAGQLITFPIHLHRDKCTKCGKCVRICPAGAMSPGTEGYPVFHKARCENCYRCIHHCPSHALSLYKLWTPRRTLADYN